LSQLPEIKRLGIYIHIPFCRGKCPYCHFYSVNYLKERIKPFLAALTCELKRRAEEKVFSSLTVDTIYLGGGTPSLLKAEEVGPIIKTVGSFFSLASSAEITLEANPDDLTEEKLSGYLSSGVNRLSIGVQSFNDRELKIINRRHKAEVAAKAFLSARRAGFNNINLDLIIGLPSQNITSLENNLAKALELNPEHISAYILELNQAEKEKWKNLLPTADEVAEMYMRTVEILTSAGYNHYEISNFAKEGYCSRHNLKYWEDEPYLGVGPSASSYDLILRSTNYPDLRRYSAAVKKGKGVFSERVRLTGTRRAAEALIMGLRKWVGVDILAFGSRYGVDLFNLLSNELSPFSEAGLIEVEKGRWRLTLRGVLLSNEVFERILSLFEE
jgi:oxygen-independent coproporphyrinogen-3 oxidase